jgi:hypothetical protein
MPESEYMKKLRDPRWQQKRLEIMQRDKFTCRGCKATTQTLHVHHVYYINNCNPWEYSESCLITLCDSCHEKETKLALDFRNNLICILAERGLLWNDFQNLCAGFTLWAGSNPKQDCAVLRCAISEPELWKELQKQVSKWYWRNISGKEV